MKKRVLMVLMTVAVLLGALTLTASAAESGSCGDHVTWTLDSDGLLTISGTGEMTNYYVGDTPWFSQRDSIVSVVVEEGVTSIGYTAFRACSNLSSVTLPESLTSIGDSAFSDCTSLCGITIPERVTVIDSYAFSGCTSLRSITIPESVTSIDFSAFSECASLSSVTLPENLTDISDRVFHNCGNLTDIALPDNLTRIGDSAFSYCTSLSSITIPEGVTTIDDSAFMSCDSLSSITIPDSVTDIGDFAFAWCTSLSSIMIPESVTSIGNSAFSDCPILITVHYSGTEVQRAGISIGTGNGGLTEATWHYGCSGADCQETPPTQPRPMDMAGSGNLEISKPSKAQLKQKWQQVTTASDLFETEPSTIYPFAAGSLTDSFLRSGLTYLNYVRYAAGLPDVQLDDTLNTDAQYGAVVLAALDKLTHYPAQPAYMDYDFYQRGSSATASSNISLRSNYDPLSGLQSSVRGCMDDNSSRDNLAAVGHRRWLLNPPLLNVGFGYASNTSSNRQYVLTKVLDQSGAYFDYDYIAWPASGNFPINLFAADVPWSVSLNPDKYRQPQAGQVRVSITRQRDGRTWAFSTVNNAPTTAREAYMTIETSGCIIFNPGSDNVTSWFGLYTVDISGLYTLSGDPTTVSYQVNFFSIDETCDYSHATEVVAPTCTKDGYTAHICRCGDAYSDTFVPATGHSYGSWEAEQDSQVRVCSTCGDTQRQETEPGNPFVDVAEDAYYFDPVLWAVNEGITNGVDATHFAPAGTCTRAQIVTFLWRANGSPASGGTNPFTDVPADAWYTDAVLWAVENGITTGTSATTFSPDAGCTRGQVATFLWRSQGQPSVNGENIFTDIAPGAYYYDAVLWAVANGITNGMGEGLFAPDATCTRGQIVTFLYRAMAK